MVITRFKQLNVWQAAHEVVLDLYEATKRFPDAERYRLTDQVLRAAISIPANIAEGFARIRRPDKARFHNISRGSASELAYYLILAGDLKYLPANHTIGARLDDVGRMLNGLASALRADR